MKIPSSVGKSIDDYRSEASSGMHCETFEAALIRYLKSQRFPSVEDVNEQISNALCDIMRKLLEDTAVAIAIRRDKVVEDWEKRTKLIKKMKSQVSCLKGLEPALADKGAPLTALLARSIRRKVKGVVRELDAISEFQRLERARFAPFQKVSSLKRDCISELDQFVLRELPRRKQEHRNLVIAGALLAAGVDSDYEGEDNLERVPMRRSRAAKEFEREQMLQLQVEQDD